MANNGANDQADVVSKSTATFVTALIINSAVAAVEIATFAVIFKRFRKIYEPRTYLVAPERRPDSELPKGFWRWIPAVLGSSAEQIIDKNGLDAYQYVRYLWLMVTIFVPLWIISWIVLMPVDAVNSGGSNQGINIFTFGNIGTSPTQQKRYAAHLLLLYLFTFYVFWLCSREMDAFVKARHAFLSSNEHACLPQSKTVLITGVPRSLLNRQAIEDFFHFLPGGINRVWLSRDLGKSMPELFDRRQKAAMKLEGAETKLAATAIKLHAQVLKARGTSTEDPNSLSQDDQESPQPVSEQLVPRQDRPTRRLGFLGLWGKKVDSIDWAKAEYLETDKELNEERSRLEERPANGSVFVQFNTQIAAHMFQQCLAHHLPLRMSGRYIEVAPDDVIWDNLSINPYQQQARRAISWSITVGIIIIWTIPVAFVGMISNINFLCQKASWLQWVCNLPGPVNGIIQGILPPAALALLFMLVPVVFRLLAMFEGIPLRSHVERSLMIRYFIFLVIQGFLVVTLASGLVSALPTIARDPSSAVTLLAQQLPNAATFFLTFIVTTQLSGVASALLRVSDLILHYVFLILLGSTPRKVYNLNYKMPNVDWGTTFPNTTLLTVICLVYSVIAPLVNGFAALGFFLTWFAYKYLFIYVYEMPPSGETGGLFFPTAIQHIFVGLYIEELCLTGLFFLARDTNGGVTAVPEGALTIVLLVLTAAVHHMINKGAYPLIGNLPLSLGGHLSQQQLSYSTSARLSDYKTQNISSDDHARRIVSDPYLRDATELANVVKANPSTMSEKGSSVAQMARNTTILGSRLAGRRGVDAFNEPVAYEPAPVIWLADDPLKVSAAALIDLKSCGIKASTTAATMDSDGKVFVRRSPPDEDWHEAYLDSDD